MSKYPENQRVIKLYNFLVENNMVRNKSDFSRKIGKNVQIIYDIFTEKLKVSSEILDLLTEVYKVNRVWTTLGEGEMFGLENNIVSDKEEIYKVSKNNCDGVPYYDVDFIGGFDLIENDQSMKPAFYINFPNYNDADAWVNITGHSMHPLISHGDIMSVKQLNDWEINILYGEIYAVVTDSYRTVKKIRKSSLGPEYIRLVPINTAEFDEQDIPKSIVRKVFQVFVTAKKLF